MNIIETGYNKHIGTSFSVYGESIFLGTQNTLILVLIWIYEYKNLNNSDLFKLTKTKIFTHCSFLILLAVYLFSDIYTTDTIWTLVMHLNTFMVATWRLPQVVENYKNKSTGKLSFLTFFFNSGGTIARVITVLIESNDFMLLSIKLITSVSSSAILFQIIYYRYKSQKSRLANM